MAKNKAKKKLQFSDIHNKLKKRAASARISFEKNHPHALDYFKTVDFDLAQIGEGTVKLAASGILASSLLFGTPTIDDMTKSVDEKLAQLPKSERESMFAAGLQEVLPPDIAPLEVEQEAAVSTLIQNFWQISARAELEGNRLNHSYGMIGAEQHLPRFAGDSAALHDEIQSAGITPARGAFGYFVNSPSELTDEIVAQEKYYVAVQTLYLPDWNSNWKKLKEWYKFRKVIVINPENGKAITAVIGDAGPAKWTGKHFGGSPEVMEYLGLYGGMRKGKVLLYFVDDPDGSVALGPVGV